MDYPVLNRNPDVAGAVVPHVRNADGTVSPVSAATPLPVALQEPVAALAWAMTNPTLDGSSDTILAANASRRAIIIVNPVGNAQVNVDIAGGTVTSAKGIPLLAGDSLKMTGADCPAGAITAIGTNTQKLVVYEGS